MTWEKLLWKLGIASRKKVQEDVKTLLDMVEGQDARIEVLHAALLAVAEKAFPTGSKEAKKFIHPLMRRQLFDKELAARPMFPYGSDASNPQ